MGKFKSILLFRILGFICLALFLGIGAGLGIRAVWADIAERTFEREREEFTQGILHQMNSIEVGDTLPDFPFELLTGDTVLLSEVVRQPTLLTVIQPGCDDCVEEVRLISSSIDDSSQASHFLLVSSANPRILLDWQSHSHHALKFVYDHKGIWQRNNNIEAIPFSLLLSGDRVVLKVIAGMVTAGEITDILEERNSAGAPEY
jgi:hypothetical protein